MFVRIFVFLILRDVFVHNVNKNSDGRCDPSQSFTVKMANNHELNTSDSKEDK